MAEIPKLKEELEKILVGMIATARSLTLYPHGHPVINQQISVLLARFDSLLKDIDKLSLGIVDEVLVFEGVPFYQPNVSVREFQKRIEERGVTAIEFHRGLRADELEEWLKLLLMEPTLIREQGFSHLIADKKIEHIQIKDIREVYQRAVDTVAEVLEESRLGKIPKATKAKEVVADLTKYVLTDRPALLALTLIKSYDNYLFNHSVNVAVLSISLAQGLKINENDLNIIGLSGLLHDIGKTLTPKAIILKPHNLTKEEWEVMRLHPVKSAEVVSKMETVPELCVRLVYEHHITFDRKGYPKLEEGRQVHPYTKIITIADCYDAITTLRPYQKPFPPREAMRIMESLSGNVIDPIYFQEFIKILGIFPVGSLVRLDTNEVAVVVETNSQNPLAPRVKILFDADARRLVHPVEVDLANQDDMKEYRNIVSTVDPLLYDLDPAQLI